MITMTDYLGKGGLLQPAKIAGFAMTSAMVDSFGLERVLNTSPINN
jgi:hypothetical protein